MDRRLLPLTAALTPALARVVRALTVAGCAAVALCAAGLAGDVMVAVALLAAAALCAVRAWRGPAPRRAWAAFALAIFVWGLGSLVDEVVLGDPVEPGLSDAFWLGFYVLGYVGTLRVLDRALADCRGWLDGGRTLGVAVNLAVANLIDRGFPAEVAAALDRHDVPAGVLQLEAWLPAAVS